MAKVDANYRISKPLKRLLAADGDHASWKRALIEAEASAKGAERMTMMYDVSPNGARKKG